MPNAQLSNKPCFYYNGTTGAIMNGLPEQFAAPYGYQKIVCTSVRETEIWSQRQRDWENVKHRMGQEQREMVEGPIKDEIRKHILHQMSNARNQLNRDFLQRHLEQYDKRADPWRWQRESFLHAEAYENGH